MTIAIWSSYNNLCITFILFYWHIQICKLEKFRAGHELDKNVYLTRNTFTFTPLHMSHDDSYDKGIFQEMNHEYNILINVLVLIGLN